MCIISGDTQILFDGRYWPSERVAHGEKATVMAFNDANDLHVPPDKANVMSLTKFFPGTLISLRFYLSADDLRRSDETDEIR